MILFNCHRTCLFGKQNWCLVTYIYCVKLFFFLFVCSLNKNVKVVWALCVWLLSAFLSALKNLNIEYWPQIQILIKTGMGVVRWCIWKKMHYFVKTALLIHLFIQKKAQINLSLFSCLLPRIADVTLQQTAHRAGILKWAIKPNGGYINPRVLILFLLINKVTGQYSQIKNTFIMKMHQF